MIKEAIGTGESLEQAQENAIALLGASLDDDIQFEILATPKKKTLGLFGGCEAKVRAYIELPDPIVEKKAEHKKPQPKKADSKEEDPQKAGNSAQKEKSADKKPKGDITVTECSENAVNANELPEGTPAKKAAEYLKNILNALGCTDITIMAEAEDSCATLNISGNGLGALIGRRGETLSAVTYLTSLAANAGNGYYRVTINIGNYRQRREATLVNLAKRMSGQVLKTGRNRTLDPMNPYERRIIHTAVQEIKGVVSNSIGEGSNRRVVISLEPGTRVEKKPVSAEPAHQKRYDAGDIPLYGKIK